MTRAAGGDEVVVELDWDVMEAKEYLSEAAVQVIERRPRMFIDRTGTKNYRPAAARALDQRYGPGPKAFGDGDDLSVRRCFLIPSSFASRPRSRLVRRPSGSDQGDRVRPIPRGG